MAIHRPLDYQLANLVFVRSGLKVCNFRPFQNLISYKVVQGLEKTKQLCMWETLYRRCSDLALYHKITFSQEMKKICYVLTK